MPEKQMKYATTFSEKAKKAFSRMHCGKWFSPVMAEIFLLQFICAFLPLHSYGIQPKGEAREVGYFTVTTVMRSAALSVFAACFALVAFIGFLCWFLRDFTEIRIPVLETVQSEYFLVPAVVSAVYNYVMLFVSNNSFIRSLRIGNSTVAAYRHAGNHIYCGFSFAGVLDLVLTCFAILLIIFKIYDTYFRKANAKVQTVVEESVENTDGGMDDIVI